MTSQVGKGSRRGDPQAAPKWDIRVRLILGGFSHDPDEVTRLVGIEPTEVKRRGDEVSWAHAVASGSTVPKVKSNFWILEVPSERNTTLAEQTRELLRILTPAAANFRKLPADKRPTISCVIYDYSREVVLEFPDDVVAGAAAMGAQINVDYYDLSTVTAEDGRRP